MRAMCLDALHASERMGTQNSPGCGSNVADTYLIARAATQSQRPEDRQKRDERSIITDEVTT